MIGLNLGADDYITQRYTAHALLALDEMKCNFLEMLETAKELNVQIPNMKILDSLIC
ncbi:hypothetical protein [Clostridioides sp. ES-S-0108-01]|uniref:hypothetical protein n=1 Tax=Clostridioides sp. ES-S-0108-01 TaxID=2770773 RepID=UPI001D0CC6D2